MYLAALKDDERFGYTVVVDNREVLTIKPTAVGTENSLNVYPGAAGASYDNLRGIGKQLTGLIIDEAEFMPSKLYDVVLPLTVNGAWLCLMSSVGGVSARLGARRLLTAKLDNGQLIFRLLNWFKPCDDCTRKGRAARCRCNVQQPQSYQNHMDVMKVRALMAALQTGAGDRELMNQEDEVSVNPLFVARDLELLHDRRQDITLTTPVSRVYIGVDPGTHAFSQTALVSLVPYQLNGKPIHVV